MWRRGNEKDPSIRPDAPYENQSGQSGHTYVHGFKGCIQRQGVSHAIYENVASVANRAGEVGEKTNIEVVKEHMALSGMAFQWGKHDAQKFMLRTRRNRIFEGVH